ncbi:hypothetical protein FGU65_01890 [Methanoculleus sp. FWC-SCC1]|uniref:Uncharacterized protein n=1 Tax=Methanoculleus frigidifontis TaxID=2584085 RepID=A0ABT8M6W0_9EURY|nr:hypothetical protein [Methanoculleus sp. FWC-SCC1]MDN7023660.1 hypothetical protein [Methanoculleus sp. FWC-SCC1]
MAIHTRFIGWEKINGMQVTGIGEIGRHGSAIFREGVEACRRRKGLDARSIPETLYGIRVTPVRIEYLDMTLRAEGLSPKQENEYSPESDRTDVCRAVF